MLTFSSGDGASHRERKGAHDKSGLVGQVGAMSPILARRAERHLWEKAEVEDTCPKACSAART